MLADVDPQYAQMMLVSGLAYALAHADLEYAANVWKMARFGQWTIIMPEFGAFLEGIGHSGGADAATWIQKRQQGLLQTQTHVNEFKEAVKQSPPNVVQVKSIWREASQQTRDEILITYCLFCKTVDEVTDYLAYTPQTTPVMTEMLNRHHGYGPNSMATHPSARPEAIYSSHSAKTYPQPAYNSK